MRAAPRIWETLRPEERAMLEEWGSAQAERATRAARALLHGASLPYRMHEATGDPAVEIVRCAARLDADLVVLGTRGLGALHHALIGSVALKVASASPVPVAVVP